MTGHDTIQYEATIEDTKVFTKPWTINLTLNRRTDRDRAFFEYVCEEEKEEVTGRSTRADRTSGVPTARRSARDEDGRMLQSASRQPACGAGCQTPPHGR